jgi:hypothetical protein
VTPKEPRFPSRAVIVREYEMTRYYRAVLRASIAIWMTAAITHAQEQTSARAIGPASSTQTQQRSTRDVILHEGGILRGRFVDDGGAPIDGARLVVRQRDRVAAVMITDAKGEFTAENVSRGVFRIESPTASGDYRLWQQDEAPPSARPVALVVSQSPTLRGQYRYRNMDLLTLGLGAGGVTLGVLALDKADDAEARANRLQTVVDQLAPASP